jgi:hypothetical protein
MKELYNELMERSFYLNTLEMTEENKGRINEVELTIVRIQQILIKEILKNT